MQAKSRSMFSLGGGGPARGGAPSATMRVPDPEGSTEQYAGSARQAPPEPEPAPIEPANAWMDYESLVLQGPEHPRRGRLTTPPDHTTAHRVTAYDRIKAISVPHDPLQTRGQFDHRYHADAPCDVPADGTLHRASVVSGRASFRIVHKTVPRLAPEVYRTIEFSNPLDAPLLSGPVDVWEDGSLLARAELERVDRGGKVRIGMGVEERVRVARNAWMEEEAAGVLRGGGTSLIHTVSMELSSALPGAVEVEVYDRIPVTDNKNILIKLEKTNPEPTTYKQDDRNNPIRGGLLWRVHLEPGRRTTIHYGYRVQIPARTELIGGNRRED